MAEVVFEQVGKVYDNGFQAVQGLDLTIHDGEFMVLVGPSGCAKSTILRMIAGLESITGGDIHIGAARVNDLPPKDRGIAMVFQNYALYPHMNAYDNMAFGLKQQKLPAVEIDQRIQQAATLLKIGHLLKHKPGQMSGGECQRVALGRAMVRQPAVFLFDEPLSNLDAKLRVSTRVGIAQLHQSLKTSQQPATMIYVTHDQVEAMTLGDRICVLNQGQIMQVDTPMNLYLHPANKFVAGFIGSPAMNFLPARVCASDQGLALDLGLNQPLPLPPAKAERLHGYFNQQVWFGIRPEHIRYRSAPPRDKPTLRADIQLIEAMGNEMYLHFLSGEWPLLSRTAYEDCAALQAGDSVHFELDVAQAHLFDVHTEVAI